MTMPHRLSRSWPTFIMLSAISLLATQQALAAPCNVSVSTEPALRTALTTTCNTAEGGTITLTANISVTSQELYYPGNGNGSLTLEGGGFTLSAAPGATWRVLNFGGIGTLTVNRITISGGAQTAGPNGNGGGIYSPAGPLVVTKSTIQNNTTANLYGGGLYGGVAISITDSIISGNGKPAVTVLGGGGGVATNTGPITITDSTITDNDTGGFGAGVFASNGTITVTNSTISNNGAGRSNLDSGGIKNMNGPVVVTNSTFSGNRTTGFGGAIGSGGNLTVTGSTFTNNEADMLGGAFYAFGGVTTVTNSTITGNRCNNAGCFPGAINAATLVLNFSTVTGNSTQASDQGQLFVTGPFTLNGSVVADPQGGINCNKKADAGSYSVEGMPNAGDTFTCLTNGVNNNQTVANTAIALGPLADNGGPTQTLMPLSTSVLVTGAAPNGLGTGITTDQRGFRRSGGFTIGAVQYISPLGGAWNNHWQILRQP